MHLLVLMVLEIVCSSFISRAGEWCNYKLTAKRLSLLSFALLQFLYPVSLTSHLNGAVWHICQLFAELLSSYSCTF